MDLAPLTTVAVATDFSEPASVAVAWGHRLAALHGARLILVHALGGSADHHLTPDEAERGLEGIAASIRQEGLRVEIVTRPGQPAEVLRTVAEEAGAEILVIGSHGHGVLKRLLLGSVADELLRTAKSPLLVVHPRDGQRTIQFRTALVGIDFNDPAQRAAELTLRTLERREESRLLLLAATQLPMTFVGPDAPAMPLIEVTEVNDAAREGIARLTHKLGGHGLSVEGLVCPGAPAEAIVDTAEDRRVDFVAVGSEPRSGASRMLLGSIARDVVHHALCPVLVVR
ncbi:MAG: universal stress protein [Phycisphaeraceae bacterium]|nr:universal stress protein [Phycisphaeraceae bacterium]